MGKWILFVATLLALTIVLTALYNEQRYLLSTGLLYISSSSATFLHFLITFCVILYITTFLTFVNNNKYTKIIYIGNYSLFLLMQILCFVYGGKTINSSVKTIKNEWENVGTNELISKVEENLKCCGFSDILSAVSNECKYKTPCSVYINPDVPLRKLKFLSFITASFFFQIYIFYSVFDILTYKSDSLIENIAI